MKATFYIVPESLQYNGAHQSEIEHKIENFAIDLRRIKDISEDEIYCNPNAYYVKIFEDFTISDILNNPDTRVIDRDVIQQLRIMWELSETDDSFEDICDVYLPNHDQNECYGLIAFNTIENVLPEYQLVYGIDGWFKFKRHFLGLYPKDAEYFVDQCKIYFESLFFHERNKDTVKRLLSDCVKKLIHHLSELNDKFPASKTNPYSRQTTLDVFNNKYSDDGQKASPEGNINKKKDLSFNFTDKNGTNKEVYCELHLKLSLDDNGSFSNDRRIYFHEGFENVNSGKILIGHIGKHL